MDKLPPEGRALVAEYYVRLLRSRVADIDAKVEDFETKVWEHVEPLDSDDPEERAFAQGKFNELKEYVRSVEVGTHREHCLDPLPVVAIALLLGSVYMV